MKWLLTAWQLTRDIGLTGLGAWLLITQSMSPHPQEPVIWAAVALLLPAAGSHIAALLSSVIGPGQSPSLPSSSEPSSPPSSHSGATGDGHGKGG